MYSLWEFEYQRHRELSMANTQTHREKVVRRTHDNKSHETAKL